MKNTAEMWLEKNQREVLGECENDKPKKLNNMKNIKIRIKNAEHSREVQEVLLKLGFKWGCGDSKIRYLKKPFLYVTKWANWKWEITYSDGNDAEAEETYFRNHKSKEVTLQDLKQMLKEKTMEQDKRSVQISKETAKEMIDSGIDSLKKLAYDTYPELDSGGLPTKWEDLEEVSGYYVHTISEIRRIVPEDALPHARNTLPTEELARSIRALCQLLYLREVYRDGWKPSVGNLEYGLKLTGNDWSLGAYINEMFSFQDLKTLFLFYNNFRDLLEQTRPFFE